MMASADLVSGYLLRETPQPFRLSALLWKGQAAGGPDGNFWGLGVHPHPGHTAARPHSGRERQLPAQPEDETVGRGISSALSVGAVYAGALPLHNTIQVALTACDLGQVVLHGEEALGFTQAFLSAGATVTLAPLWAVDDAATAELSVAYHRALLSTERPTAAQAMQQAMAAVRHARPTWQHPFYWAGCLPAGDGAFRLPPGAPDDALGAAYHSSR